MSLHDHPTRDELLLPDHHRRIEALLDELRSVARGDDRDALRDAWAALEDEVLAHLAAEEEHLLPAFAEDHPEQAQEIRADHTTIRTLLADLGVSVDLKRFSAGVADELAERLRAHARREDEGLYPWASEHLATRWPHFLEVLLRRVTHRPPAPTSPP